MIPSNFDWFLHAMLFYHTQYVTQKKMEKDEEGEPEDEESDEEAWIWHLSKTSWVFIFVIHAQYPESSTWHSIYYLFIFYDFMAIFSLKRDKFLYWDVSIDPEHSTQTSSSTLAMIPISFLIFQWFSSLKIDKFPYLDVFMDPELSTPTSTTVRTISIFFRIF